MFKNRSPIELRQASEVLLYEFSMLTALQVGLASGIAGESPMTNSLVESFAIHTRILFGFFHGEKSRVTDVVAAEFFEEPSVWLKRRPSVTPLLTRAKAMADRQVAHFTEERLTLTTQKKTWRHNEIVQDLGRVYAEFASLGCRHKVGSLWQPEPRSDDEEV